MILIKEKLLCMLLKGWEVGKASMFVVWRGGGVWRGDRFGKGWDSERLRRLRSREASLGELNGGEVVDKDDAVMMVFVWAGDIYPTDNPLLASNNTSANYNKIYRTQNRNATRAVLSLYSKQGSAETVSQGISFKVNEEGSRWI